MGISKEEFKMVTMNNNARKTHKFIQTSADLSVAFKDNVYFGVDKNEGKRAMERMGHNTYAVTGYFQKDGADAKHAAWLARAQEQRSLLRQVWSEASNNSISDSVKSLAESVKNLASTAVASVYQFAGRVDETLTSGCKILKDSFNSMYETGAEMFEKGYNKLFGAPSLSYAAPAMAYNYIPAHTGFVGNSIAAQMLAPAPRMLAPEYATYKAPALRMA